MASGEGKFVDVNGYEYEGEWRHDMPNGKGTEIDGSGDKYKGEFVMGKKFGRGVYRWADDSLYIGGFYDNMFNGKIRHNIGEGKILLKNQSVYNGQWLFGLMHGYGVFEWPNGKKYVGNYVNGFR
jgi:hypothetical protein